MNSGDVVLAGCRDFGARWKDHVVANAITVLPVSIVGLIAVAGLAPDLVVDLIGNTLSPDELETRFAAVPTEEWMRFGLAYGAFVLVSGIANGIALAACLLLEQAHLANSRLGVRAALGQATKRLPSLLWMFSLSLLPILVGLVLCLLPGLWLITMWWVAPVALIHEGSSGRRSLGRSFRLVKGAFWFSALVVLLEFIGLGTIQSAATQSIPLLLPGADGMQAMTFFVMMLVSTLAGLVTLALHACIATRLYLELNARSWPPPAATQ